jgi:alpha-methylacyl-CoA racemase
MSTTTAEDSKSYSHSSTAGPSSSSTPPLQGIVVLDMSRLLPGPFASQLLLDLGAEVIKVEDTQGGDYSRYFPPICDDGSSPTFHALNRGKKSIMLNLKRVENQKKLLKLISTCDVLLESFRPGVLDALGLSRTALKAANPSLIVCSISGYGQTGPDNMHAGHDINYLAKAGVLGMMKRPTPLPVQVADICAGSYPAVVQILAAIRRKERTGEGAYIDVSMTDGAFALLAMPLSRHTYEPDEQVPVGKGNDMLVGGIPCYDVYETSDGFISVGALEPKFWKPLVKALGLPELIPMQFSQGEEGEQVRRQLQAVFSTKTNRQWTEHFADIDCAVEIVAQPDEVWKTDKQLASRELMIPICIQGRTFHVPKTPLCMNGVHHSNEPGPQIGQHTEEILRSRL